MTEEEEKAAYIIIGQKIEKLFEGNTTPLTDKELELLRKLVLGTKDKLPKFKT